MTSKYVPDYIMAVGLAAVVVATAGLLGATGYWLVLAGGIATAMAGAMVKGSAHDEPAADAGA